MDVNSAKQESYEMFSKLFQQSNETLNPKVLFDTSNFKFEIFCFNPLGQVINTPFKG